ncbi:uncharacterized protein EMH_0007120 [Eimeria mitis]|uniref:Uncharacterized protein n=1 Tax=Eimeria mitis TaxID=44415 RepID=U6JZ81_9EIME|nr:uncharacterized protein EMH_0007120 [Eimeria mitis]CDJ30754.1 hypothetical protein EMH_0007120 [Eimeria mitis]
MGLQRAVRQPLQEEQGSVCCSSEEEDAADMALRFRVRTHKHQLQQHEGDGGPRLQHVVDKPIAWGPTVMPLASVLGDSEGAKTDKDLKGKRHRTDIQGTRDSFELKGVFSVDECQRLVEAAEAQGFEYWAKEADDFSCSSVSDRKNECHSSRGSSSNGANSNKNNGSNGSSNSGGSSSVSKRANHNYRSAHTLEVEHSDLADLIWVGVPE